MCGTVAPVTIAAEYPQRYTAACSIATTVLRCGLGPIRNLSDESGRVGPYDIHEYDTMLDMSHSRRFGNL